MPRKQSLEWIRKRVEARRGYRPTLETLQRMSDAKKGSKNPSFGSHRSPESLAKWKLSMKGYRHSDDTRKKLSVAKKRYYEKNPEAIDKYKGRNNPMFGKSGPLNPMYGKHLSKDARHQLSVGRLGRYKGPMNPFFGKSHKESTKKLMKDKWVFRKNLQKNNRIELMLQHALRDNGINFETHAQVPGRPDIFIKPNICIFVDGCYWHGCKCKFDANTTGTRADYIRTRMEHDKDINKELETKGFVVLRFWEHEINNDIFGCMKRIDNNRLS